MSEEKQKEDEGLQGDQPEGAAGEHDNGAEEAPPEVVTALQEALQIAQEESEKHLDNWQRTQADLDNYKKRVARDQQQMTHDVKGRVAKQYLDVLDDLTRALADKPAEGDGAVWAEGIELIHRKLNTILDNEGVKAMDVEGQMFDPSFHEAIGQVESDDHESGQIVEVVQQGYFIGERVLRPAMVRVAV
ncbi:MAG: nucleotide exchange factor GrpE [Chloroflexi bacterium]|nr:MAG: nucleotide exchange factor GrpE [Chloroflexota bacterium]MBL1193946.1 nucleotide exchange factor GrpE [Chloroflexota bacterium]NOH11240.1 nucleotide exchange factor GrpE [Chloroflexota bacterium]